VRVCGARGRRAFVARGVGSRGGGGGERAAGGAGEAICADVWSREGSE
jgi:hypothetical protein